MKRTMDAILLALAVVLLIFTAVMIWLYYRTNAIPDTLCTCVFTICGGECGAMAWIRTTKDKYRSETAVPECTDEEAEG